MSHSVDEDILKMAAKLYFPYVNNCFIYSNTYGVQLYVLCVKDVKYAIFGISRLLPPPCLKTAASMQIS